MKQAINANQCPLCDQPNHCAMAANKEAKQCWCQQTHIPSDKLSQLPVARVNKVCICKHCAEK